MTSTVIYEGDLRTVATHLQSGTSIETDAPTDNQGKGERFSPTDLVATALGACMATTMGIKARDMKVDLRDMKLSILKIMKPDPRRIAGGPWAVGGGLEHQPRRVMGRLDVRQNASRHGYTERRRDNTAKHGCPMVIDQIFHGE